MHYHVVMRDGTAANPARVETFQMLEEAESAAQLLSERHIQPSWIPTRYPGRASRLHEVAVYLDRRTLRRRRAGRRAGVLCEPPRRSDVALDLLPCSQRGGGRRRTAYALTAQTTLI